MNIYCNSILAAGQDGNVTTDQMSSLVSEHIHVSSGQVHI